MKMKIVLTVFACFISASAAFAECKSGAGQCPKSGGQGSDCLQSADCEKSGGCPIIGKFMKKAHFFLSHADEIGLSDDQVKQIKAMKTEMQKTSIRQAAEMQVFMLDIEAKLHEDTVDVEGINAMMDKGGAGMTEGGKAAVLAYAKLKAVPTPAQYAKAKEIWKKNS